MKKVYSLQTLGWSLSLATFLVGCGGGGGTTSTTDGTSTTDSTYAISGTVPGTLIEAYCEDGSFYSTTSTTNGTSEHPFILKLPKNLNCKLVMITNETATNPADYIITPIKFKSDGKFGTYLTADKNIDLGYVDLQTPAVNSWTAGVKPVVEVIVNNKNMHIKEPDINGIDKMDDDNDGIPNIYEDDDNDGVVSKYDEDDDGDNILDIDEITNDKDHDGIIDIDDKDDDNDGKEDSEDQKNSNKNSLTVTLPSTFTANTGRLLGSQCAQCHGTNGVSSSEIDSIKGEDNLTHEIYDDDELMNAQANGYTSTEILAIESWLNNVQ